MKWKGVFPKFTIQYCTIFTLILRYICRLSTLNWRNYFVSLKKYYSSRITQTYYKASVKEFIGNIKFQIVINLPSSSDIVQALRHRVVQKLANCPTFYLLSLKYFGDFFLRIFSIDCFALAVADSRFFSRSTSQYLNKFPIFDTLAQTSLSAKCLKSGRIWTNVSEWNIRTKFRFIWKYYINCPTHLNSFSYEKSKRFSFNTALLWILMSVIKGVNIQ